MDVKAKLAEKYQKADPAVWLERTGGKYKVAFVRLDGLEYEVTWRGNVLERTAKGRFRIVTDEHTRHAVKSLVDQYLAQRPEPVKRRRRR